MQWGRRDEAALRTICVKNVKFKIIKKDSLSVSRMPLLQCGLHETFNWAAGWT